MYVAPSVPPFTAFGRFVAIGPPHPGNPFPVFVVSEDKWGSSSTFSYRGRLHAFRSVPWVVRSLGPGCTGTLQDTPQIGFTNRGSTGVEIHLSNAPPMAPATLLLGFSSTTWLGMTLPLSATPFGFPGCNLYTSVEFAVPRLTGATGINTGYATFAVNVPLAFEGASFTVHGQWLVLGSGATAPGALSGALSDALSWRH